MLVAPIPPVELNHLENVGQTLCGQPSREGQHFLIKWQKLSVGNDCQFHLRGVIPAAGCNSRTCTVEKSHSISPFFPLRGAKNMLFERQILV